MTDTPKIFHLFKKPAAPLPVVGKKPYVAYTASEHKSPNVLFIGEHGRPDNRVVLASTYLMQIVSGNTNEIALLYTGSVLGLVGRHLDPLFEALQHEKVVSVQCYMPEVHLELPQNTTATVIERIFTLSSQQFWERYGGNAEPLP